MRGAGKFILSGAIHSTVASVRFCSYENDESIDALVFNGTIYKNLG
jgi:hypothetical protein